MLIPVQHGYFILWESHTANPTGQYRPIWALALATSQVLEVHRALSPAPVPPCVLESNAYGEIPAVAQVENGAVWSHG